MNFEVTDLVTEIDKDTVYKGLLQYNLSKLEDTNARDLGIYHKIDGEIKAGLIGETHGNWLEVDYLWVSEDLRGQGIGSRLLKCAEQTALERGCTHCFLNTFGFQAPEFYKKYGYEEVFVLNNFPVSGKRHFYIKSL